MQGALQMSVRQNLNKYFKNCCNCCAISLRGRKLEAANDLKWKGEG